MFSRDPGAPGERWIFNAEDAKSAENSRDGGTAMRRRAWCVVAAVPLVGGAIVLGVMAVAAWRDRAAERERITSVYRRVAERGTYLQYNKYDRYTLPRDGAETCLRAIRSSGGKDRLVIRLTDEYAVLACRLSYPGRVEHEWTLAPYVLRLAPPDVDPSDGVDAEEAARLHHYHASGWITQHLDEQSVTSLLLSSINPRQEADGSWIVDSGIGQIAGHGMRSHIGADGRLIEVHPYFSPD